MRVPDPLYVRNMSESEVRKRDIVGSSDYTSGLCNSWKWKVNTKPRHHVCFTIFLMKWKCSSLFALNKLHVHVVHAALMFTFREAIKHDFVEKKCPTPHKSASHNLRARQFSKDQITAKPWEVVRTSRTGCFSTWLISLAHSLTRFPSLSLPLCLGDFLLRNYY